MAKITYGDGKVLQSTSLRALTAALETNARAGKVEMPDMNSDTADTARALRFVRVVNPRDGQKFENILGAHRRIIEKGLEAKVLRYKARKARLTMKRKEARVTINAPDLVDFFANEKKVHSY